MVLLESSLETVDPTLRLQWDEERRSWEKEGACKGLGPSGDERWLFEGRKGESMHDDVVPCHVNWLREL